MTLFVQVLSLELAGYYFSDHIRIFPVHEERVWLFCVLIVALSFKCLPWRFYMSSYPLLRTRPVWARPSQGPAGVFIMSFFQTRTLINISHSLSIRKYLIWHNIIVYFVFWFFETLKSLHPFRICTDLSLDSLVGGLLCLTRSTILRPIWRT